MRFETDMKFSEVEELVGNNTAKRMFDLMKGQTGELKNGNLYMYSYDLQRAYDRVQCQKTETRI